MSPPDGFIRFEKTNLAAPLQFLAMIMLVTVPKRSFDKSFRRPIMAAMRFPKKCFSTVTLVISRACQRQSVRHFSRSRQPRSGYRTLCALAGVSLYGGAVELVRF